jgi:PP-loop superfamily ATP-utilizing enzyme
VNSGPADGHPSLARAERVLREFGFRTARVEAIDPEGATAVITADTAERERLVGSLGVDLSRRLKELGFRYVALDLDPAS